MSVRSHTSFEDAPGRSAAGAPVKTINIALQGGNAHGAFAWGVLDLLLEDERIGIEAISAASAGAMNAVALASGHATGGREGARRALADFWLAVSERSAFSPLPATPWDPSAGAEQFDLAPAFVAYDLMTRLYSPYQLNPLNRNPLRDVLERCVDFAALRGTPAVKLFLSATNVRTGKARVFRTEEITVDVVLASACLPFMNQAVEIDGEAYWDGGYMGNPALYPLIYNATARDVLIVHVDPLVRHGVPKTSQEILNRVNEITFNSSLMREMRVIAFVSRLIDEGTIAPDRMKKMLIHAVADDDFIRTLGVASKLNADFEFLTALHDRGRDRAIAWLTDNFDAIGERATADFAAYL